jgi:hypothetical protein
MESLKERPHTKTAVVTGSWADDQRVVARAPEVFGRIDGVVAKAGTLVVRPAGQVL